jgi:hypothetical protein
VVGGLVLQSLFTVLKYGYEPLDSVECVVLNCIRRMRGFRLNGSVVRFDARIESFNGRIVRKPCVRFWIQGMTQAL